MNGKKVLSHLGLNRRYAGIYGFFNSAELLTNCINFAVEIAFFYYKSSKLDEYLKIMLQIYSKRGFPNYFEDVLIMAHQHRLINL